MKIRLKHIPNPIGLVLVSPILVLNILRELITWLLDKVEVAIVFLAIVLGMLWPLGVIMYTGYFLNKVFG